jgi:hypothetical protein
MPAPICPKLAPVIHNESRESDYGVWDRQMPEYERCHGSDCSMWVPVMERRGIDSEPDVFRHLHEGLNQDPITHPELSGARGLCADNLRREPWDDPASE